MRSSPAAIAEILKSVAARQHGYFTARQAIEAGYADSIHAYHVRNGDWEKAGRGVYRLASEPLPRYPALVVWLLWSRDRDDRPQGVYCRETALALHGLADMQEGSAKMIVPSRFRKNCELPAGLQLIKGDLRPTEMEYTDGLPVTTLQRTLADLRAAGTGAISETLLEQLLRNEMNAARPSQLASPAAGETTHPFQYEEEPETRPVRRRHVRSSEWSPGLSFEDALDAGLD